MRDQFNIDRKGQSSEDESARTARAAIRWGWVETLPQVFDACPDRQAHQATQTAQEQGKPAQADQVETESEGGCVSEGDPGQIEGKADTQAKPKKKTDANNRREFAPEVGEQFRQAAEIFLRHGLVPHYRVADWMAEAGVATGAV